MEGKRGRQELGIVYFSVAYVVDLGNYTVDSILVDTLDVRFVHGLQKLAGIDAPAAVEVYPVELMAERFELPSHPCVQVGRIVLHQVANKQIQRGLLHEGTALVLAQLIY